ncbi:MAG TPA: DUF2807 domain-containing protein [Candidatus Paceibacterota bacterium]
MNEIITATIAKQLFQIEKEAYEKLANYLDSIRQKFASHPDKEDIVFDIEFGIAEHLKNKSGVISNEDINKVITEMGQPEDIDEDPSSPKQEQNKTHDTAKKLYRNTEDQVIAGVSSGIATYLKIDPLIIRMIFVVSLFAGGAGVIVYLITWVVLPEAKTPAEKLQMSGKAVTVESVREMAEKGVEKIRKHSGLIKKIGHVINLIITGIAKFFIRGLFPLIRVFIGVIIMVVAVAVLFALLAAFFVILFNINSPLVDAPFLQSLRHSLFYAVLLLGLIVSFIPILFLSFLAKIIITNKNRIARSIGLTLLGVWIAAVITGLAVAPRVISDYKEFTETSIDYQQVSRTIQLPEFKSISASSSTMITITQGTSQEVLVSGRNNNIDKIIFEVVEGNLNIKRQSKVRICIFCSISSPEIKIKIPDLRSLELSNSSSAVVSDYQFKNLNLVSENSSRITLNNIRAGSIKSEIKNSSRITANGKTDSLDVITTNSSSFRGYELIANTVKASSRNSSRIQVQAVRTLEASAQNSSVVEYMGTPDLTEDSTSSSRILKIEPIVY